MGMLVLSRHRDEAVTIGEDVRVIVVDIRGDKVRLGIEAPRSLPVHRQEVYDQIKSESDAIQVELEALNSVSETPVDFVYGITLKHRSNDLDKRVTVLESPNSDVAITLVGKMFNSFAFPVSRASVQCFGVSNQLAREEAAKWMFAKWVDRYEPFRVA